MEPVKILDEADLLAQAEARASGNGFVSFEFEVPELDPLAVLETMKPAVLKVVEQLLAALQLVPLAQHWRALVAAVVSPERVTLALVALAAPG